jgi:hypothetical protein
MKKSNDPTSISRKKWLIGGATAFGLVVLASTGFAAYVIGQSINSANEDVNVAVETAKNASYSFEATLGDASITLGETTIPQNNSGFVTEDAEDAVGDLEITFSSMVLSYGSGAASTLPTKVVFSLDYSIEANLMNKTSTDSIGKHGDAPTGGWDYIVAPSPSTPITFDKSKAVVNNDVSVITLQNQTVSFGWGSFFGNKSPLNYYNEKFPSGGSVDDGNNVLTELNAMKTAMYGKTLTLTATVVAE